MLNFEQYFYNDHRNINIFRRRQLETRRRVGGVVLNI